MKLYPLLGILALTSQVLATTIPPSDANIEVRGTRYFQRLETGQRFQRHREDVLQLPRKELGINPDKARNNSGIVLAFRTNSKKITARFTILSANYMGSAFGVFENGEQINEFKFNPKAKEVILEFASSKTGSTFFEIALPSFASVEFQGLDIDDGASMEHLPDCKKPVYVALGDSISHGTGQNGATHKTWPFLLSRKLDAELFNLAVGGGKVSVPIGQMLGDWKHIDLITILVGYNDLHFDAKTPKSYAVKYSELLDAIRENHPDTPIYCISLLYTKKPVNEKTGHTANEFRAALSKLVKGREATDNNLYFIAGEEITSTGNLQAENPKDPVHLSEEGAILLANDLYPILKSNEKR